MVKGKYQIVSAIKHGGKILHEGEVHDLPLEIAEQAGWRVKAYVEPAKEEKAAEPAKEEKAAEPAKEEKAAEPAQELKKSKK